MLRSDKDIVAWLEPIFTCQQDEAKMTPEEREAHTRLCTERVEALNAAADCGISGRRAIVAAMGAQIIQAGETPPRLRGDQLIGEYAASIAEVDGTMLHGIFVEFDVDAYTTNVEAYVALGGICASMIDRTSDEEYAAAVIGPNPAEASEQSDG